MKEIWKFLLYAFITSVIIFGACPAVEGAAECSALSLQVAVAVRAERNASGHWLLGAAASADVAYRARPLLASHARLHLDACPGGWAALTSSTAVRAHHPDYEQMPFKPALNSLYRLHTRALPWEEAAAACRRDGAHLLVLNSETEALVVKEFFSRKPQLEAAYNSFWFAVGFRRFLGRNETVLGGILENTGYNKWEQITITPETECGIIDRRLLYSVEDCKRARGFICELEN